MTSAVLAQAANTTSLQGSVVEVGGSPIVGANIQVGESSAVTDEKGHFSVSPLIPGHRVVKVSATTHQVAEREIDLVPGANTLATLTLEATPVEFAAITVTGATDAAEVQFDEKRESETLTDTVSEKSLRNSNAQSGSDIIKDVAGVSVSKGAGGTSNVSVRGIDQRMLRITVDGQRQGGSGNPLDSIPPEVVQSMEVTKTFTPDMDADAVGGVININTGGNVIKDAYLQGRHQLNYNPLAPHAGTRNSLTFGQPFPLFADERNASILATASYDDQYYHRERLSNLREWTAQISPGPNPYTGTSVPVLTLPVIESSDEERQRLGLVLNADARFDQSSVYWRSNYSSDETKRNRDLNDTNPAIGTPLSLTPEDGVFSGVPLSMRNQDQDVQRDALNLSLGGKTKFSKNDADIVIAYVQTHETEPHTFETGFLSDHDYRIHYSLADPYEPVYTLFDEAVPGDTTSETNPSRYHLNYFYDTVNELEERDGSAKFNLKMNLGDVGDYLKFGGKAQQRRRKVNTDRNAYDAGPQPRDMNGLIDTPLITMQTVGYRYGPVPSASSVASLLYTDPATLQLNSTETQINSTSGDYEVTENIWAMYAMGKLVYTKWSLLGGVRVEGTHVDSTGMAMNLDSSGQLQDFTQIDAVNDYIEVLPGLHFRYEPKTGLLYRGSVTRSMSRPNSADIAPYRTLSFVDHRSRIGAPDLKPYLATNFDVSLDWYDPKYGLISVAAFYKKIDHFITDSQYPVIIGNLGEFIEFKRVNGESARALGGEFSWQSPNWNLPLTLGKANIDLNYNYNHGEAHHPTRPNETFPLPRQVDHQANLQFHDVRGSLSIDATVSYRTGWWEDLIAPGFDNYIISAWDAEISGAYKIGKHIRITAGASNLLDRPTRHYAGIETRMNDSQYNGREYNLGLQWKT